MYGNMVFSFAFQSLSDNSHSDECLTDKYSQYAKKCCYYFMRLKNDIKTKYIKLKCSE